MALISNITDLRKHLKVNVNFEFSDIEPSLEVAANKYIKKILGTTLYNEVKTQFDVNSLSTANTKLLPYLQSPIAKIGFVEYIPFLQVSISSGGIFINSNKDRKSAFQWQIEQLQNSSKEQGFNAIETLIEFLEENKADYPDWDTSFQDDYFIKTAIDFDKYLKIGESRLTFLALLPAQKLALEKHIKPLLCNGYFTELMDELKENDVDALNQPIVDLLKNAIANLTMYYGSHDLSVEKNVFGIYTNEISDNQKKASKIPADEGRINRLNKTYLEKATTYMQSARSMLHYNIADFTTYAASECYKSENEGIDINNRGLEQKDSFLHIG